jgi:hypothetical protein
MDASGSLVEWLCGSELICVLQTFKGRRVLDHHIEGRDSVLGLESDESSWVKLPVRAAGSALRRVRFDPCSCRYASKVGPRGETDQLRRLKPEWQTGPSRSAKTSLSRL